MSNPPYYADGSFGYYDVTPGHTQTEIYELAGRLEHLVMQNYGVIVSSSLARDEALRVLNGQKNITSASLSLYNREKNRRRQP